MLDKKHFNRIRQSTRSNIGRQIYQLRKNQVLSYQVPQPPGSGLDRTGCESGKAIGH